jgi:hypothetical protein
MGSMGGRHKKALFRPDSKKGIFPAAASIGFRSSRSRLIEFLVSVRDLERIDKLVQIAVQNALKPI